MLAYRSFLLLTIIAISLIATVYAGTTAEGLSFLRMKEQEIGVEKTPSGLLYKQLKAGTGKTPFVDSPCEVHYTGKLIDGTEFDSSYKHGQPLTFSPNQVIRGWTEALQKMKEGEKAEIYIPSELGYGDRGAGGKIPGGAVLVFTMELIKVKGQSSDEL